MVAMASLDELAAAARLLPGGAPPASAANLSALASSRVGERGHQPFLTFYDDATGERTELSYATFDNWVSKTANMLAEELELGRGDRVATVAGNHWTTVVVAFACWKVGCVVVPIDADDPVVQARGMLEASGAETAFIREDLLAELDTLRHGTALRQLVAVGTGLGARLTSDIDLPGDVLPYAEEVLAFGDDYDDPTVELDDEALLILPPRGGEMPAGVRLTQGNLLAGAEAICAWGVGRDDRLLCASSAQTADGLALVHLGAFAAGGSVVLTRASDPARTWRRVSDERVTLLAMSPSGLDQLPDEPPPEGLHGALLPAGGAPAVISTALDNLPLAVGHGVVEATCASTLTPRELDGETRTWLDTADGRPVGAATARAAITALDEDGGPSASGVPGRLAVRGPVVMAGYDGRADLDEEVFASGWLATSERGFTDVGPDGRTHAFVTGPA